MALDYICPEIFDKTKIISGVTQKNLSLFPKFGLSLSKADILSDDDLFLHKRVFAKLLGTNNELMKYQTQTHSSEIKEVFADTPDTESDGLFTSAKGIILNVKIADCVAILIFDPKKEVIMALHSGWRGTAHNICKKGITLIKEKYNSNPEDIIVYISPGASGEKYEVGEDVANFFPNSINKISENKYLFDNKKEIKSQLISAGILESNIEVSELCTIDNQLFHSYRRDKQLSGRMSAFIGMLKNEE